MLEQLDLFPVAVRPQLRETGWDYDGDTYRHDSGATAARRCWHDEDAKRLVYEAQINGGEWLPTDERFHETLERALHAKATTD